MWAEAHDSFYTLGMYMLWVQAESGYGMEILWMEGDISQKLSETVGSG